MRPDPIRVAIDLETTGLRPDQDVIIEIGAVKFAGARILDTFQSFVSISTSLPYRIHRLTGITNANLRRAPQLSALLAPLRAFIGSAPLVGHSVAFDASFLRRVGLAQRNPLLDTYELAAMLLPNLPSYTLASVADALAVSSSTHHRALADADLARGVFLALLERMSALDTTTLHQLAALPAASDWSPMRLITGEVHERAEAVKSSPFARLLEVAPSTPDLDPAIDPSLASMALALGEPETNSAALDDEPVAVTASARSEALAAWMRDGGPLLLEVERTEAAQLATLTEVARTAASRLGEQVIIAASDGEEMKRVARSLLPRALTRARLDAAQAPIAELDEREAYLCLNRWFGVAREERGQPLSSEVTRGMAKLTVWSRETRTGLRADVALSGAEADAWARARSGPEFAESDADCPYRANGYCFVERAEQRTRAAAFVVTTHAALATRLRGRDTLLPDAARVVILDGRQIEDELRRQETFTLDGASALALLDTLANGDGREAGLLPLAATLVGETSHAAEWRGAVERAREALQAVCAALRAVQQEGQERGSRAGSARGESFDNGSLRVDSAIRASQSWDTLVSRWEVCRDALVSVVAAAREAGAALQQGEPSPRAGGARADLLGLARRIDTLAARGAEVIGGAREIETVSWLRAPQIFQWSDSQRDRKNGQNGAQAGESGSAAAPVGEPAEQGRLLAEAPALVSAPIRVGGLLAPLWQAGRGVAVVGWALAVDHDFEHTRGALGLPESTPAFAISPDYSGQTLLGLPVDAPEPAEPGFHAQLETLVVALARALDGDVVVIFPSHAALRTAANGIRRTLEREDILTLAQGIDGSARQLWQTFTQQPRTTLLGAGAFWEGAELRYRAPACVVVARTPFPPQSDPLVAARASVWDDPQAQYMVPQAALKLRQALGGLAWSHSRRNAIILYDHRLQSRAYGDPILATLPTCAIRTRPAADLVERVAEWTRE